MKKILLSILLSAALLPIRAAEPAPSVASAREWCDTTAITGLTGIYVWPDREAIVLVRPASPGLPTPVYHLVCLESPDIYVPPGTLIGVLTPTAVGSSYKLEAYTGFNEKGGSRRQKYTAKADLSKGEIVLSSARLKTTVRPLSLIPGLRGILNVSRENPASSQPHAMTRIYPLSSAGRDNELLWPRYF